ncbi:MAG: NUDIX domain-containing protein [Dehalococcoidales bacterium]|nr:NUDIX domain-containing protein [Dehalococcoidales bacterium]
MVMYYKYALCVIKDNKLLLQEEEGEDLYLLPGGRPEDSEGAIQALCREVKEELGIELDLATLDFIGQFEDVAEENPDALVRVELYNGNYHGELKPGAEVKKLVWFDKNDDWTMLPSITRNKILPTLIEKGLLT